MVKKIANRNKKYPYLIFLFAMIVGASSYADLPLSKATKRAQSGLSDSQKKILLDSDGDGLPNTIEKQLKLNPRSRDTNHDGVSDGKGDANHNGITDGREFLEGKMDTDNDGLSDLDEDSLASDPYNPDTNNNGIKDGSELGRTNLRVARSEYDGESGGERDDNDNDNDNDDGSSFSPPNSPVTTPKPAKSKRPAKKKPIPACKSPRQKNCYRKPIKKPASPPTQTPPRVPTARPPVVVTPKPPTVTTPKPPTQAPPGNFDSNGNTTKFGIPAGLSGNIGRGGSTWSGSCSGCHGSEKTNRNFGQIKGSMSIPAMSGIRLADSQLADLVAYLNRSQK